MKLKQTSNIMMDQKLMKIMINIILQGLLTSFKVTLYLYELDWPIIQYHTFNNNVGDILVFLSESLQFLNAVSVQK